MGAERRRHERFRTELSVRVWVWEKMDSLEGTCLNLSEGGMLLRLDEPLPKGWQVVLEFEPGSKGRKISPEARIVWSVESMPSSPGHAGIGVAFGAMSPAERKVLQAAIAELGRG